MAWTGCNKIPQNICPLWKTLCGRTLCQKIEICLGWDISCPKFCDRKAKLYPTIKPIPTPTHSPPTTPVLHATRQELQKENRQLRQELLGAKAQTQDLEAALETCTQAPPPLPPLCTGMGQWEVLL